MFIKRINNDDAIINLSGNTENSHLFFHGQELTSIKEITNGTVEFLINNLNYSKTEIKNQLADYRNLLSKINNNDDDLATIFKTFAPILGTGNYVIKTKRTKKHFTLLEYLNFDRTFHGGDLTLIALQKFEELNRETVEKYKDEIKANKLPAIIVLNFLDIDNYANYYYILDGHHKARAYQELNIEPNLIIFEKIPDDNKEKIIYYQNNQYIYQKGIEATLVECSLQLNFDQKDPNFGKSVKREIKIHPTEWSSGTVIDKNESSLIQKEVDDFFLTNNLFADVAKKLKKNSIMFKLKKFLKNLFN